MQTHHISRGPRVHLIFSYARLYIYIYDLTFRPTSPLFPFVQRSNRALKKKERERKEIEFASSPSVNLSWPIPWIIDSLHPEAAVTAKKDYTGFIRGFARDLACPADIDRRGNRIFVYLPPLLNHSFIHLNIREIKSDVDLHFSILALFFLRR